MTHFFYRWRRIFFIDDAFFLSMTHFAITSPACLRCSHYIFFPLGHINNTDSNCVIMRVFSRGFPLAFLKFEGRFWSWPRTCLNQRYWKCFACGSEISARGIPAWQSAEHYWKQMLAFSQTSASCPCPGVEEVDYSLYPDEPLQRDWLRCYVEEAHAVDNPDVELDPQALHIKVDALYKQVNKFALVSGWWGALIFCFLPRSRSNPQIKKVYCRNKEANNAGYDTKEMPAKQAFPCWGVWGRVGGVAKTMLVFRRNELLYFFKSSILPSDWNENQAERSCWPRMSCHPRTPPTLQMRLDKVAARDAGTAGGLGAVKKLRAMETYKKQKNRCEVCLFLFSKQC